MLITNRKKGPFQITPTARSIRPASHDGGGALWVIVLAGGEGTRLASLTSALHGRPLPKQFAVLTGEHSLLQMTLLRARSLVPWERIVVVATGGYCALARRQGLALGPCTFLDQPANLGTGPGLVLPLAYIRSVDPEGRVLVLPSDHYVKHSGHFAAALEQLGFAGALEHGVALLGAEPDRPETEYGWILPGRLVTMRPPLRTVKGFFEKPPPALARQLMFRKGLWNTFVIAGRIDRLWALAAEGLPDHTRRFEDGPADLASAAARPLLERLYAELSAADFSRSVLARSSDLMVATAPACGWSDWGTPRRVFESLVGTPELEQLKRRLPRQSDVLGARSGGAEEVPRI